MMGGVVVGMVEYWRDGRLDVCEECWDLMCRRL